MKTSALGSTFEISLRILLLLDEVHNASLDEQQIGAIDFISVYAATSVCWMRTYTDMVITDSANILQDNT